MIAGRAAQFQRDQVILLVGVGARPVVPPMPRCRSYPTRPASDTGPARSPSASCPDRGLAGAWRAATAIPWTRPSCTGFTENAAPCGQVAAVLGATGKISTLPLRVDIVSKSRV